MRCKACNKELNDFESTRKSKVTKEYYDLCTGCYYHVRDYEVSDEDDVTYVVADDDYDT